MREIKFRVWTGCGMEYNITTGKFGTFYVNPMNNGLDVKDSASLTSLTTKYQEPVKLMQFTGLKDKNCKEIYEGDIVKFKIIFTSGTDEVVFNEGRFELKNISIGGEKRSVDNIANYCEVVGNIYENPELLTN